MKLLSQDKNSFILVSNGRASYCSPSSLYRYIRDRELSWPLEDEEERFPILLATHEVLKWE